jgi:hypothetical protein
MEVNLKTTRDLLGIEIIEIGRTFIEDKTGCYPLMDTLCFKTKSHAIVQILKANQDELNIQVGDSSSEPIVDFEFEIDDEDKLITKPVEVVCLDFPCKVASITEFWAGVQGKEFLT